jgi:hypothetical protein
MPANPQRFVGSCDLPICSRQVTPVARQYHAPGADRGRETALAGELVRPRCTRQSEVTRVVQLVGAIGRDLVDQLPASRARKRFQVPASSTGLSARTARVESAGIIVTWMSLITTALWPSMTTGGLGCVAVGGEECPDRVFGVAVERFCGWGFHPTRLGDLFVVLGRHSMTGKISLTLASRQLSGLAVT